MIFIWDSTAVGSITREMAFMDEPSPSLWMERHADENEPADWWNEDWRLMIVDRMFIGDVRRVPQVLEGPNDHRYSR